MPKQHRSSRGVAAEEMGSFSYERSDGSSFKGQRRRAPPVDSETLKRAYMLQNFQFVIRQDVQEMKFCSSLPQSQSRFLEAFFSSDSAAPWEAVTAVVVRLPELEIQCPICLDPPISARITSCGHIFCLPCILQHLAVRRADKQYRTCPVCQSFISEGMLRPCVLHSVASPRVGTPMRFTLLQRKANSCTLLCPDDPPFAPDAFPLPRFGDPSAEFSRYVLATAASDAAQRERDEAELARALDAVESLPRPYTQYNSAAAHFLIAAVEAARGEIALPLHNNKSRASPLSAPRREPADAVPYDIYAASDGQPYYLHPLCYKMLRHDAEARGAPLPRAVEAPLETVETFVQNDAARRHYKAFAHVPQHGTLRLCVADMRGVVGAETLAAFAAPLARLRDTRRTNSGGAENAENSENAKNAENAENAEDALWRAYLRRYRAAEALSPSPSPSPDFFARGGAAELPRLELPDACAAAEPREAPRASRWNAENPRRMFATPPMQPAVPTWGGHVFNPHKPSSASK